MSNALSTRITNLPASATLAMAAKARELKQQGVDIIGLSLGEPDFNTPEFIKQAAIEAVEDNYNSYTPVDGYLELKEAVCRKFKRDNQLDYQPSQIVVSTGAKQSIANAIQVLVDPGDDVLLVAMATTALLRTRQFNAQELANVAWTFACWGQLDEVLLVAMTATALLLMSVFNAQELATVAWASPPGASWTKCGLWQWPQQRCCG